MAIDPKLLVVKPVNELTEVTGLQEGSLLFYDGSSNLKRISVDTFNNLSKTAKPLAPTDPTPTVEGLYAPTVSGTYANAGGLIAQEGYYTLFFFNGTTWTKSETLLPSNEELTANSYIYPLKWNPVNYDITKVRGIPITGDMPLTGWGYVSYPLTTEERIINSIGYFIYSKIPDNTVTAKLYETTDSYEAFLPTSPNSTLLAEKTFENFNQNEKGRAWWFLDASVTISSGKRVVVVWESANENSLGVYRITGGAIDLRERRVTQGSFYLDFNGYGGDEPIMTLFTNQEVSDIQNSNIFDNIFLPEEFPTVVGKQFNLYKANILNVPNPQDYITRFRNVTFNWTSNPDNSGIFQTNFGLQFTPTEAGKTWNMVFEILDKNYNVIAQKKFNIVTYANTSGSGQKVFDRAGDSLTQYNDGRTVRTLYNYLTAGGGITPKFIGVKTTSNVNVKHNGFEGQGIDLFIGTSSPYYVGGEINFQAYAASQGVSTIDFLGIQEGINSVLSGIDFNPDINHFMDSYEELISIALSADKGFPSMKIIISLEPFGGFDDAFSASRNVLELKRKMFLYYKALIDRFKDNPNVYFHYAFAQIDAKYGYPFTMEAPNVYDTSGILEIPIYSDPVHPNDMGYDMVASSYYAMIRKLI